MDVSLAVSIASLIVSVAGIAMQWPRKGNGKHRR